MRLTVPLLGLLLALGGCNRPRFDTPVHAYTSFHRLVQKGEYKEAWGALSEATRARLAQQADAVEKATQGKVKADPIPFFFSNVPQPAPVNQVTVAEERGEEVRLKVESSRGEQQVRMVREPSGWKVDLTESLQR